MSRQKHEIIAYFDGACEPKNPEGIATYGFVIYKDGEKITDGYGLVCEPFSWGSSNNTAEYTAMIEALKYLVENGHTKDYVTIRGDSQLTIFQMTGRYSVNAERIIPLHEKAINLKRPFSNLNFEWIPREENEEADRLSHIAYTEYLDSHPEIIEKIQPLLATEKQKNFLGRLHIEYDKYIGKREASRLIDRKLHRNR